MCDKNCDPELSLESILKRTHGLFDIQIKVNIRDTEGLSLAYTPGVATPCLEIQKDLSKAYEQTNKGNSILVLTDSSKFAGDKKCNYIKKTVEGKSWNNNASMIYLESFIAYYKHATNIDAYPMILDLALIKDAETLLDTVDKVALSYGGVELFGIAPERIEEFKKLTIENYATIVETYSIIPSSLVKLIALIAGEYANKLYENDEDKIKGIIEMMVYLLNKKYEDDMTKCFLLSAIR